VVSSGIQPGTVFYTPPSFAQLSTRSELLNQTQSQLYVRFFLLKTHIYRLYHDSGRRESDAQAYLTRHAQDLDEIRGLWTAIVRRREALSVCLHPPIFVSLVVVGLLLSVSFHCMSNWLCSFKTCRNFFLAKRKLQTS
jgi:hypothetical protein